LSPHLIDGEYDSALAPAIKERGIGQLVYTSTQGEEPLFPNYYPLPPEKTLHDENARLSARVPDLLKTVNQAVNEKKCVISGVIVAGWADAGLHPQTFWLGYATGAAIAWNLSGAAADELAERFYASFYGTENADIKKVYALTSSQAQFYEDSWDWVDSNFRTPIFGYHLAVYTVPKPARDQILFMLPVPDANNLSLQSNWTDSNDKRLHLAQSFLKESDELMVLLGKLNGHVNNQYNIDVMKTISAVCRQNISMLFDLKKINELLLSASKEANSNPGHAIQLIDQSLDLTSILKAERNNVLDTLITVWYKDWLPLVKNANGRTYLHQVDDVKDHRPIRTPDMSYLIYRELNYPLDKWVEQTLKARNAFARKHSLKQRDFNLMWKDYSTRSLH
jgi:hypothetical protein